MAVITHTVNYPSRESEFLYVHFTDTHIGHAACDEAKLRHDVEVIRKTPNAFWSIGGDTMDGIIHKDKRYRPYALPEWLQGKKDILRHQVNRAYDIFAPIADKCAAIAEGNHEDDNTAYYDRDLYGEFVIKMAAEKGVKPEAIALGYEGFLNLNFVRSGEGWKSGGWKMRVYIHHGYGGGNLPGSHALTLGRALDQNECDLVLMGHRHVLNLVGQVRVGVRGEKQVMPAGLGMFMPSYLLPYAKNGHATYSVRKGYRPQMTGVHPIAIQPDKKRFEVRISNLGGLYYKGDV